MAGLRFAKLITISVLLMGTLISCSSGEPNDLSDGNGVNNGASDFADSDVRGIIVPHHLLVEKFINELYSEVSNSNIERVIILSPNHFNYGHFYIQGTDEDFGEIEVDKDFVRSIDESSVLEIDNRYFNKEHGITVQLAFTEKYFPNAKVVPIMIKRDAPERDLNSLFEAISKQDLSNTFFIASIDFCHYQNEESSLKNDETTIEWLEKWGNEGLEPGSYNEILDLAFPLDLTNDDSTAMDSPESFFVFLGLMEEVGADNFMFWKRTSTSSLSGNDKPFENTSHIFALFK